MSALVRLALRALGAPSQVRPRLGGLFERDAIGDAGEAGIASVAAQTSVLRLGDQVVTAPARGEQGPATPRSQPDAIPAATGILPPFDTSPIPIEASAPRAHTAADPAGAALPAPAAGRAGEAPATEAVRPVFAPLIERTIREAARGFDRDESRDAATAAPAAYHPLLPERAARHAPGAPLAPRPEAAAAGPADIQISIGRLEVRGEPERRPPPPAPRRGPRLMSLEDYLAKGRRR